jgi:hypothetical protein
MLLRTCFASGMSERAARLVHVPVAPLPLERFGEVLDVDQPEALSTAHGGGVARMLTSLIAYTRGRAWTPAGW